VAPEPITPAMIEAAARVYAHREEFSEAKWPEYAETTESMLRAAAAHVHKTPDTNEDAARIYAHRDVFSEAKWRNYAETTESMLRAAAAVREPKPDIQAVTAPISAFRVFDRVTYQHGMLGKLDGTVTRVRGEWPEQKIDVSYKVDGEPRSSVMTTDQAAVKLEHRV
jgi:hypothetical protein